MWKGFPEEGWTSYWISVDERYKHPMMCHAHRFASIGDHVRKMVRIIPSMSFVIYWLGINKSYLMKGSLVINIKITCLRERVRISTMIEDMSTFLAPDRNISTTKLNWRLESYQTLGRIRRRRLVGIVGRHDMLKRHIRRRVLKWKKRLIIFKEM